MVVRGPALRQVGRRVPAGKHPPPGISLALVACGGPALHRRAGGLLPIVIYNGKRRWHAATDVRQMFAPLPEDFLGYLPRHPYLLIVRMLPRSRVCPALR